MSEIAVRVLEAFPEPETSALQHDVFMDDEQSKLLANVLASEAASRPVGRTIPDRSIIAKLRLGFHISGFEYSEVYGPLVRLTYRVGDERRKLHDQRARPIRPAE